MSPSPVIRVIDCHICRWENDTRLYLLLQRARDKMYAGDWRMVGGKMETQATLQGFHKETAWQAALREVREETRLPVQALYSVPYVNQFYEWQHDRINAIPVFVAVTDSATPTLDNEHSSFGWFPLQEAVEKLPWPGQKAGLQAADLLLSTDNSLQNHMRVEYQP